MAHKLKIDKKYYLMESDLQKNEDESDLVCSIICNFN